MRGVVRWLISTVAVGLVVAVLYGMVGEFFIELAREWGWYDRPSERLNVAMDAFSSFVGQTWFICAAAFSVGLALGMWVDLFLRRGAGSVPNSQASPSDSAGEFRAEPKTLNPSDEYFSRRRINVMNFYSPSNNFNGDKTFSDCELVGPAVVVFFGDVSMAEMKQDHCDFIAYKDKAAILNAVLFNNSILRRCKFFRLTVLVHESYVDHIDAAFGDIRWLTRDDWSDL